MQNLAFERDNVRNEAAPDIVHFPGPPLTPTPSRTRRSAFFRTIRYRLVIPMLRTRSSPEYLARGTMLGLILAFTPTTGLHSTLVLAIWFVADRIFKWEFSVILALAWVWVANVFTVVPIYYLLYVTGQAMLGRLGSHSGYAQFTHLWQRMHVGDLSLWQEVELMTKIMVKDWGLSMCLGSIPWAAITGALGYWLTLKAVRTYRHGRAERRHRKAQHRS